MHIRETRHTAPLSSAKHQYRMVCFNEQGSNWRQPVDPTLRATVNIPV
jgi:hypothetical protein